jgi:hypothetical protein
MPTNDPQAHTAARAAREAGRDRAQAKRNNGRTGSIQVRLPADLKARLDAAAEERLLASNVLIIKALEDFLDRLLPVDETLLTRPEQAARTVVHIQGEVLAPADYVTQAQHHYEHNRGDHAEQYASGCADCDADQRPTEGSRPIDVEGTR